MMPMDLVTNCKSISNSNFTLQLISLIKRLECQDLQAGGAAGDNEPPAFAAFRSEPQLLLQARPLGVTTVPFKPFIQLVIARSISFE